MKRRRFILSSATALASGMFTSLRSPTLGATNARNTLPLTTVNCPSPAKLRGGWAALAAVLASRGWTKDVYAFPDQWLYHDGGGNWVCLRFKQKDQIILIGHDHEYSETYYGEAAKYFGETETDLLAGAPDWWGFNLDPDPFGEWIGFVYGWNGQKWQRANYEKSDGFESIGLLDACSMEDTETIGLYASDSPGLNGRPPNPEALRLLVAADVNITPSLLKDVVPGWNIEAGVKAGRKFLQMEV